jgi:hypothetical protein
VPIHFILLPIVLFVVIPAFLVKENVEELDSLDPMGFLLLLLAAVAAIFTLLLVEHALEKIKIGTYFSKLIEFICFLVVITGFVLPVSVSTGMKDPHFVPVDLVHLLIAIALASIMLHQSSTKLRKPIYMTIILFVAINAATAIPAIYSLSPGNKTTEKSIFNLSSDKNIIVLGFDGIPGPVVNELLEENPEFKEIFAGFVFFDQVASSSPATSASIATSLYGNVNFKENYPTAKTLWGSAPEKLLTNRLNTNGYDVSTYGKYNFEFNEPSRQHKNLAHRKSTNLFNILNYSIARALTQFFVISGELGDQIDSMLNSTLGHLSGNDFEQNIDFSNSNSPHWKKTLTPTILDFREYVENLHISSAKPIAHFSHYTHTHYPVVFDRHCQFRGHDKVWFEKNQNRNAVKEEAYCALTQYARFLQKLKELDVFENSLIVLKSDHGKPVKYNDHIPDKYNDQDNIESFAIRKHFFWGYGRYLPFLAIKDFGPTSPGVVHNQHAVILDDLARTLCVHSGITADCSEYNGYDLLSDDFSGIEMAKVTMFVVKSSESNHTYDTHEAITIERGMDILENLHETLSQEYLNSSVSCDKKIEIRDGMELNNGHSDFNSWMTWNHRGSSYLRFKQNRECMNTRLLLNGSQTGIRKE